MIGLVLVTHGKLATEFKLALEHVMGQQEQIIAIDIHAEDDMTVRREEIEAAVSTVDDGSGVIILTDLFGGTPSNMAISLMQDDKIEVVAGLNLPMLVQLAQIRANCSLPEAASKGQEAARKYITIASNVLKGDG